MADYKIPTPPANLFSRPFADQGARTIIPENSDQPGRASLPEGFPEITQLPLSQGGVAPNRLDFQGILYMLSSFAFWQQSGGMFPYKEELNYKAPCLIFYDGKLWWCLAENGPATSAGAIAPGSNENYWQDLFSMLTGSASPNAFGNPVGTVIAYYGASAPAGYLACDGASFSATQYPQLYELLGNSTLPDLRGQFLRGHDARSGRALGSIQSDAGRNVTGRAPVGESYAGFNRHFTGAFYTSGFGQPGIGSTDGDNAMAYFDASRIWGAEHTADEFRPTNVTLLYCIKHD